MTVEPQQPDAAKKPAVPPPWVVLADAKLTVRAPLPRVFEALVNADQLAQWWATDVRVEAELGGRYEGTIAEGRIEGTITAIDGPGQFSFVWPMTTEAGPVETTVAYHLTPKGPESFVRLLHRAPKAIPGEWNAVWNRAFESLKALLEGDAPGPE